MTEIEIEVIADSNELLEDVFGKGMDQISDGELRKIPQTGAELRLVKHQPARGFGLNEVVTLVLSLGTGVASSLVASWLTDRLQRNAVSIRLNRRRCPLEVAVLEIRIQEIVSACEKSEAEPQKADAQTEDENKTKGKL